MSYLEEQIGNGKMTLSHSFQVYLKLEGINYKGLWDKFFGNVDATVVKEPILKEFIKNLNLQHPKHQQENVHLEIFVKHDDHVIYCSYVNETEMNKIVTSKFLWVSVQSISINDALLDFAPRIDNKQDYS